MLKRHSQFIQLLLRVNDLVVAVTSWLLAYWLRIFGTEIGLSRHVSPPFSDFAPSMCFSLILMLLVFNRFGLYGPKRTKTVAGELADLARAVTIIWAMTYVVTTFMREVKPSGLMMAEVLVVWLMLGAVNRFAVRAALRWFRRRGWNQRTAAIVGTGRLAQKLYHALRRNIWTGIAPQYFIGDSQRQPELLGLTVLGGEEAIQDIMSARPVDIVFVALPSERRDEVGEVLDGLAGFDVDVRVVPDLLSFHFLRHDVAQLGEIPIITMTYSPQHGWNSLIKRLFDIVVSAAAIVVMAVPMLMIAIVIKLTSRGPVFYRHGRTSLGGRPFRIIKFRTMVQGAEDDTGPVWASADDSRVTPVGRFLRRTSLDELPQLFNVFAGQMSLVGPRPERPELIDRFRHQVPRYALRHHVKAGLTGWAQVYGLRGRTSLRKRVQYDLYYITNWTFGLDLWILLLTPFRAMSRPGDQ